MPFFWSTRNYGAVFLGLDGGKRGKTKRRAATKRAKASRRRNR